VESLGGLSDGSVAIFHRLKQAGVPGHALCNYNRQKFDIVCELFPFLRTFDELVLSGDVGLVKPDAEIFEILISRCGMDVGRTVFIDDSIANVATAARLGFARIHFNEKTTDLEAELPRHGLPADALSQP
jgi:2-haloacid dehalogenase